MESDPYSTHNPNNSNGRSKAFSPWDKLNRSEKITWILAIISLIADAFAIFQIVGLIAGGVSVPGLLVVTPGFAFGIWVLAVFMYLALLHYYWEQNKSAKRFDNVFSMWLIKEVVLDFKYPLLLLPLLVIILTLLSIVSAAAGAGAAQLLAFFLLVIGSIVIISSKSMVVFGSSSDSVTPFFKKHVESEWQFWAERINAEFRRKVWLTSNDFKDMTLVRKLNHKELQYILAKYASLQPSKFRFGDVYDIEKSKRVQYHFQAIVAYNALVKLDALDQTRFFVR